jgi:hypothetical protein
VSAPVPKFTLKLETVPPNCGFVLPWVATKRAPVPDPVELLDEQPIKQSTADETSKAARKRNFIPILSPCVVLKLSQHRATPRSGRPKSIVTFICVSGMPGKSKLRRVVGTVVKEESCPVRHFAGSENGFHKLREEVDPALGRSA